VEISRSIAKVLRRPRWAGAPLAVAVLLTAGCGGGDAGDADDAPADTTTAGDAGEEAEMADAAAGAGSLEDQLNDPELTATPSGLKYRDLQAGAGDEARGGQVAVVHYTGWLVDGTKFDSSHDRNEPFQFPLGGGRVIKGWDEGVQGMKVGGVRRLVIPPDLGYGSQGAGAVIPPNATLIFEVELLEVKPA
jgi:FKBP-type peptidyl-prolyl cis-trans isomerase